MSVTLKTHFELGAPLARQPMSGCVRCVHRHQQQVERRAEGPEVARLGVAPREEDLGREVVRRAEERVRTPLRWQRAAEAQVDQRRV